MSHSVYLYIIRKDALQGYETIVMPQRYAPNARDESKMGYYVLAQALKWHYGIDFDSEDIVTMEDGKPYLINKPVSFNIAHSSHYVTCAVSTARVGVDIEEERTVPAQILHKILTPEEMRQGADQLDAWLVKEAHYKYLGGSTGTTFANSTGLELLAKQAHYIEKRSGYTCVLFHESGADIQVFHGLDGSAT